MSAFDDALAPFPEQTQTVFVPYSFDDLMSMPPKQWLIDRVIGAGDIGMLYGESSSGKTFVVINMILSACTGSQWAARFDVTRPLNVAYCAGEGTDGLPARFKAALAFQKMSKLQNFTFFKTVPQLFNGDPNTTDPTIEAIDRFVNEWEARQEAGQAAPLDILFIDTLHTATVSADENSARDMGKVLHACRRAVKALGCAIILVHHTGKNGESERGSSALRGAMDVMIKISPISEGSTKAVMYCTKLKDGERWKEQTFERYDMKEFNSACIIWDAPNEGKPTAKSKGEGYQGVMLTYMKEQPGVKMTAKTLADVAGIEQKYAIELLRKMAKSGKCKKELTDTSEKSSSRNPLGYFVE